MPRIVTCRIDYSNSHFLVVAHAHPRSRLAILGLMLALLPIGGCGGSSSSPTAAATPVPGCPVLVAPPGHQTFARNDLQIANTGGQCRDIGGSTVTVANSGVLTAQVEWETPGAVMRIEIWRGLFVERIAIGAKLDALSCARATAAVSPGQYTLAACHTSESATPVSFTFRTPIRVSATFP